MIGDAGIKSSKFKSRGFVRKITSNKYIRAQRRDLKTATLITDLYSLLEKNIHNKYLIRKVRKNISANRSFSSYKNWIDKISGIAHSSSWNAINKKCIQLDEETSSDSNLSSLLRKQTKKVCLQHLMRALSQEPRGKIWRSRRKIKKILQNNLQTVLRRDMLSSLMNFFDKIEKSQRTLSYFSQMITNYFVETRKEIPSKLLKKIYIDSDLTRIVQQHGLNRHQEHVVFYQELVYLAKRLNSVLADSSSTSAYVDSSIYEILNFYELNKDNLPHRKSLNRLLLIGKELSRSKFSNNGQQLFHKIISSNPPLDIAREAHFQNLWTDIRENDYKQVLVKIQNNRLDKDFKALPAKIKFWVAFTYDQLNLKKEASGFYKELIQRHPFNYYSTIASQKVTQSSDSIKTEVSTKLIIGAELDVEQGFQKFLQRIPFRNFSKKVLAKSFRRRIRRLKAWSQLGTADLLRAESRDCLSLNARQIFRWHKSFKKEDLSKLREQMAIVVANILNSGTNYLMTFKVLKSGFSKNYVNANLETLRALFPTPYLRNIKRYRSPIDPLLLLSLIRQESAFNPEARSHAGATGLMQLMPSTARTIRRNVSRRDLERVSHNLKIGIKYFNYLYKKFDNNLVHTLAAYNAGETKLRQWKQRVFTNPSLLHTIEEIPYSETRNYVKYIYRNLYFYKLLSNKALDLGEINSIYDVALVAN